MYPSAIENQLSHYNSLKMKRFIYSFLFFCLMTATSKAQKWQVFLEVPGQPDSISSICNAWDNGVLHFPQPLAMDYWTWFELYDTVFVNNNFALEVRMRNTLADGGISAFDPGIYINGCPNDAGITLMGEARAQRFNSIYAGDASTYDKPELVQDFTDWVVITLAFRDNVLYATHNGNLFYTLPYNGDISFIHDLRIRFKGSGRLDYLRLYNENAQVIWSEDFNDCNATVPFPDWQAQATFSVSADTMICRGEPLSITANSAIPATFDWTGPNGFSANQAGFQLSNVNAADTGYYFVTATFADCVQLRDSVHIGLVPQEIPSAGFLGKDTTLCLGSTLALGRSYPCASYLWQDGSTDSVFVVQNPGIYSVQIEMDGQTYRDSIHIDYYLMPIVNLRKDTTICPGDTIILDATAPNAVRYRWQDGSDNATFTVQMEGIFAVTITDVCGNTASDAVLVNYFPVLRSLNLGDDVSLCPSETLTLNAANEAAVSYRWQDGSTQPTFTVQAPGSYFVTVADHCGNVLTDSIQVQYYSIITSIHLGNDTTLCPGEILELDVTNMAAASYRWQDGSTTPIYVARQSGIYRISVTDNCGNTATDEIKISYFDVLKSVHLGQDTSLCPGTVLHLDVSDPAAISYLWQDGNANPEQLISEPGIYAVTLADNCGNVLSDSIQITYYQLITSVDLGEDFILCTGETDILDVTNEAAASYLWQDGSTKSVFRVDRPGIFSVTMSDNCGNSVSDEVRVRFESTPEANIGTDTIVCEGSVYRLSATANNARFYRWQDGSDEASYPVTKPGIYTVTLGNICGYNTYSIRVDFKYCGPCRTSVPNAFSPDGDNVNDRLEVFSECTFTSYDFRVFDRWGVQVFASQNPTEFWDGTFQGTNLKAGVYIWRLIYEADDGSSNTLTGDCTLLR